MIVLIESDWNLKQVVSDMINAKVESINRIRLEFKAKEKVSGSLSEIRGINRIRLEFKDLKNLSTDWVWNPY